MNLNMMTFGAETDGVSYKFGTGSKAFAMGSWDMSNKALSKKMGRFTYKDKVDLLFGAMYNAKADTVDFLLNNSHISVLYTCPIVHTCFYEILRNILGELHSSIEDGDDDAIRVYDRVTRYFRI